MFGKIIAEFISTMFFKKKGFMSDKTTHNKKNSNESADKMTQNEHSEEVLANESAAGQTGEDEQALVEIDEEKVKKLEADLDELKDKHLRLVAEFDNFRRRTAKERIELTQTAGKDVLQSMLTVLDDVDRASKQLETTTDITVLKEGISLVFNKLRNILMQKGLKVMDASGKEFDADLHEAITEIPAPTPDMVGKVVDVVEQGYYLNDKLIRHAKVVVGK